jgi:hypothetical protein
LGVETASFKVVEVLVIPTALHEVVINVNSTLVVATVESTVSDSKESLGILTVGVFAVALEEGKGSDEVPLFQVVTSVGKF